MIFINGDVVEIKLGTYCISIRGFNIGPILGTNAHNSLYSIPAGRHYVMAFVFYNFSLSSIIRSTITLINEDFGEIEQQILTAGFV